MSVIDSWIRHNKSDQLRHTYERNNDRKNKQLSSTTRLVSYIRPSVIRKTCPELDVVATAQEI